MSSPRGQPAGKVGFGKFLSTDSRHRATGVNATDEANRFLWETEGFLDSETPYYLQGEAFAEVQRAHRRLAATCACTTPSVHT